MALFPALEPIGRRYSLGSFPITTQSYSAADVRFLHGATATGAVTRVLLDATDGERTWTTIGVSPNIIEASWRALEESLVYGLLHTTA